MISVPSCMGIPKRVDTAHSEIWVAGTPSASHGTANTKVCRFNTVQKNRGGDLIYTDDVAFGGKISVVAGGVYAITAFLRDTAAAMSAAIVINGKEPSTNVTSIVDTTTVLTIGRLDLVTSYTDLTLCGVTYLSPGDYLWIQDTGDLDANLSALLAGLRVVKLSD